MRIVVILTLVIVSLFAREAIPKSRANRTGPLKVAVIDTGFGLNDLGHDAPLCLYGHKDFTKDGLLSYSYVTKVPVPMDIHGHGTNIVGLIKEYAETKIDYCFVIIKFYSETQTGKQNLAASVKSLIYANNINVDIINFSGGGPNFDLKEKNAVKKFLNKGGIFVAAAGNEHEELDGVVNTYYPAMYDKRIKVVGNLNYLRVRNPSSNYGPYVNTWEVGTNQLAYGITMTGTSQATAVTTGKIISAYH